MPRRDLVLRILVLLLGSSAGLWAQNSSAPPPAPAESAPAKSQDSSPAPAASSPQSSGQSSSGQSSSGSSPTAPREEFPFPGDAPKSNSTARGASSLAPPRSDAVDAGALPDGESSSKDEQIDLSAPTDDAKAHPKSGDALTDMAAGSGNSDVSEFHPWDPHKAAKDVEVGDFYFRRQNYRGAEDRYREALVYKDNDAVATFHLAVCLEKMDRPDEALEEYESYLKILPHGPEAEKAKKAIERLKRTNASAGPGE
jgi:tetratricopeptide (TPR) repeat protein